MLRSYQLAASAAVQSAWAERRSALLSLPCGTGKTITFCHVGQQREGRILVLAHRAELLDQCYDTLRQHYGERAQYEMAGRRADRGWERPKWTLATIQSLYRRKEQWQPDTFSTVIFDEVHHATAKTWHALYSYFSGAKVLGVSATPERDGLEMLFPICDYKMNLYDAIVQGWLTDIQAVEINAKIDLASVKTLAGDFNQGQLAAVMERNQAVYTVAAETVRLAGHRQTIVYGVSVAQSRQICDQINFLRPNSALFLSGQTPAYERRAGIADFRREAYQFLVNCELACLDSQTEILTRRGWVGYDEINASDLIANWHYGGCVTFSEPLGIEVRKRRPGEGMAVVNTRRMSMRVTFDHRVPFKLPDQIHYREFRASGLLGRKGCIPICGWAEPEPLLAPQEQRKDGQRRIDPHGLSLAACQLIGFWLGDGSACYLQSGGVEYTLHNECSLQKLNHWVESLLREVGVDFRKKRKGNTFQWSIGRGTGSGSQKRRGLYSLEPYLDKNGSDLLWGLNREQFWHLMYGFHMADGNHRDCEEQRSGTILIHNANQPLLDTLQAIASCRGFGTSLRWKPNSGAYPGAGLIGTLIVTPRSKFFLSDGFRAEESGHFNETVWCVKVQSSWIIARRNGKVFVTGNTEGNDFPAVSCIAVARPTKSKTLHTQMIGRGLRPIVPVTDDTDRRAAIAASGKPFCTVLDFVGNCGRHRLVTVMSHFQTKERHKGIVADWLRTGKQFLVTRVEDEAEKVIDTLPAVNVKIISRSKSIDPLGILTSALAQSTNKKAHPAALGLIRKHYWFKNAEIESLNVNEASALRAELVRRWKNGLCSVKQARVLVRYGYDPDLNRAQAGEIITKLSRNGWKALT